MVDTKFESIVCFGEVLWDMLPDGPQPGGAPLNVAIHLKRQGRNPWLVSRTGKDTEGEKLRRFLHHSGLDLRFVQTDEKLPTSQVLIHLDSEKNATYEICEPVAWDNIQWNADLETLARKAGLIVFGTLAARNQTTCNTLLEFLESSGATRLLDVNLRRPFDKKEHVERLLGLADFVKLNDEELEKIASWRGVTGSEFELIQWLAEFYRCPTVCVTRGANGAALFYENSFTEHPGFEVDAVDTVGAGDSFLAALIAKLSEGNSPGNALQFACATGAFVASCKGAVPEYSPLEIHSIFSKIPR